MLDKHFERLEAPKAMRSRQANRSRSLMRTWVRSFPCNLGIGEMWTVSRDGQRFLMNTIVGRASAVPITMILNWRANGDQGSER